MHFGRLITALLALTLVSVNAYPHVHLLRVDPHQTDSAIVTVHGPHIALYDPQRRSRHQLYLFLPGTHVKAEDSLGMDRAFARWGYHAVSLDYENNVMAASLGEDRDPSAFGRYREDIVTGAPIGPVVQVDPANSILKRFRRLLLYLVEHDPSGGWNEFLENDQPVWSRILVAGHSQGSGHAAYIGKLFRVDRVLMFSGPQDYMVASDAPAPWQEQPGATPPDRFFAFLNLKDPFDVHHQIANCAVLMHLAHPDILMVQPGQVIRGEHHILINNFPTSRHHNSTLFPQFEGVWRYMATINVQ